jgi:hypothetical protein
LARKKPKPSRLPAELRRLDCRFSEDLAVPSLHERPSRVQGYAFGSFLVLPLYTAEGERVFTEVHLSPLYSLFNARCGGCLAASSRSGAPFFGEYLPEGTQPIRDYHTVTIVHANLIEASDRFFQQRKSILKTAPLIEQEEILLERSEVYLM